MPAHTSHRVGTSTGTPLWWLHPIWFITIPIMAMSLAAYLIPEADFQASWRTPKAFAIGDLALCTAVSGIFALGCLIASWTGSGFARNQRMAPGPRDVHVGQEELKVLFNIAMIITITGYVIWFGSILRQGGISMFTTMLMGGKGSSDDLKRTATDAMITGVTTFTQFGMGTALLGIYLGFTQEIGRAHV